MKKTPDTPPGLERLASISPKNFAVPPVAREVGLAVLAEFDVPDDALVYCESNSKGLFLRLQSGEREDRLLILDAKRPPPPSRNLVDLDNLEAVTPKQREKLRAFLQAHDGTDTGLLAASELAKFKFDPEAEQEPESNTHIYAGFVSRGDLTVWGGEKKHRKSTVMLQLAISMATGRDFLKLRFVAGKPLTVVIIDFESKGGSLKRRYDGIVNAMKLDAREQEQLRTNLTILEVRKILQAGQSFPKFAAPGKNKTPDASADANFWRELAAQSRADVLIIDPLRNLHDAEENDSTAIAALLTEMRRVFRDATVILTHHMRKSNEHAGHLFEDLRRFSDGLRGSSALTAHADVVVLQERVQNETTDEIIYLGAFMRDEADIEPFQITESDPESFFFEMTTQMPVHLKASFEALKGRSWRNKTSAVEAIRVAAAQKPPGISRAAAFRHVNILLRLGIVTENSDGSISANAAFSETNK